MDRAKYRRELLIHRCVFVVTLALLATGTIGCGRAAVPHDSDAILGWWCVVESIADGDADTENVGSVYRFYSSGSENRLEYYNHESQGWKNYRIDPAATPKTLESFHASQSATGSGIYELNGDILRWRDSLESQRLNFSDRPQGRWWDFTLKRMTLSEAEARLEILQEARNRLETEETE